jgi:homoserine kinase
VSRERVRVRVPATSANLGPGFDALALALDIFDEVTLTRLPPAASGPAARPRISVQGLGAGRLPEDESLYAYQGVLAVYRHLRRSVPPLALDLLNRIPRSGGLGGSAAASVAGLVAANALEGDALTQTDLLELASEMEGHPDNSSAAILGGLVISVKGRAGLIARRVPVPPQLTAVMVLPEQAISTRQSRGGVLPRFVPLGDAVYNLGRTALLVAAMQSGDWSVLREAMDDRLHQPPRGRLFPALRPTIAAALAAGAHGAALSGSGSAIIALATVRQTEIAAAMRGAAAAHGYPGTTAIVAVSQVGATVLDG